MRLGFRNIEIFIVAAISWMTAQQKCQIVKKCYFLERLPISVANIKSFIE